MWACSETTNHDVTGSRTIEARIRPIRPHLHHGQGESTMMLTSGDWITIASCVLGSGTTTVIVQHLLDWLEETKSREETPEVKARNCISRHSALSLLKTVHRDAVARGWVPLDDLDEAQEIYDSYHTLGGNGAGSRIIHDLQQMENYPTNQSNQSE